MALTLANGPDTSVARFASEVRTGLARTGQKELPSKYLYDAVGCALFDVEEIGRRHGMRAEGQWIDHDGPFAHTLLRVE